MGAGFFWVNMTKKQLYSIDKFTGLNSESWPAGKEDMFITYLMGKFGGYIWDLNVEDPLVSSWIGDQVSFIGGNEIISVDTGSKVIELYVEDINPIVNGLVTGWVDISNDLEKIYSLQLEHKENINEIGYVSRKLYYHGKNVETVASTVLKLTPDDFKKYTRKADVGKYDIDTLITAAIRKHGSWEAVYKLLLKSLPEIEIEDRPAKVARIRCSVCSNTSDFSCGGCQQVSYCSRGCQSQDWEKHKNVCKYGQ